jgi:predicted acyltransferase
MRKLKEDSFTGRAYALDALRGYAILTMVLSATIAMTMLPAWMYHAQVPPPDHVFHPEIPGLTWVDMVFPSFLFSMGAAFPFSIGKKFSRGVSRFRLSMSALWRGILLMFFGVFIAHCFPYVLSNPQDMRSWLIAIFAFILLFPMFMRIPAKIPDWSRHAIQLGAVLVALILMLSVKYADGRGFSCGENDMDIIIIILANMAIFGSLLYIFTIGNVKARLIVLALLFALSLGAMSPQPSWASAVANFKPFPGFYSFHYLKYLFIIVPGSIAGEYLYDWMGRRKSSDVTDSGVAIGMLLESLAFVLCNLYCLYMRFLVLNMVLNLLLIILGWCIIRKAHGDMAALWKRVFLLGAFLIALGLLIEPFEGGIKKDPVNFSYLFTSGGLAAMSLIFFSVLCDYWRLQRGTAFLVMSGQNPMIAYVSGSLLIMPLMSILGILNPFFTFCSSGPWLGVLQGFILTALSMLVTMFFTRIKWFWRT